MHIQSADRWDLRDDSSVGASPGMKEKEFESGAAADSSASLSHLSLPSPLPTQTQRKALFKMRKQNLTTMDWIGMQDFISYRTMSILMEK